MDGRTLTIRAAGSGAGMPVQPGVLAQAVRGECRSGLHPHPALAGAPASSDQLGEPGCGSTRAVPLDVAVVDLAADIGRDRIRDDVRSGRLKVEPVTGAIALKLVGDVVVLFEVVPQGEVQERTPVRGQLHRRGEAALNDREVTGCEMAVQVVHAAGKTTREAAAAIFVSPKTVEYHLRHVYEKLGIRSRDELVAALSTLDR
jgi:DNA-binding CsgD family transcriptional regulator